MEEKETKDSDSDKKKDSDSDSDSDKKKKKKVINWQHTRWFRSGCVKSHKVIVSCVGSVPCSFFSLHHREVPPKVVHLFEPVQLLL
jgi:hypothetical protein